ncbi:bifunctional 4-hydroxy-2-oxoglutarate aldolase/2-dehydro-3-deoxy-phosphogluconate aldolase [bacterium]|nr:MAG: bifunctional 4-hydroxy-2-oxoglutarate aldolase/2-dehydro-3-deoxy-phosphogluconate aldolase [bacterium]
MHISDFRKRPFLGILRNIEKELIEPIVDTSISAGLRAIEITMNTPDAPAIIKRACSRSCDKIAIGAGTVLDMDMLKLALDSGATFIVSPCLIKDVCAYCAENSITNFPGALTPSEVYQAHKLGATMIKVFPAGLFGTRYFRDLKGPFSDIELLACGGVNEDNVKSYFDAGASAIAFGESIFKKNLLMARDFKQIESDIKALIAAKEI